MTLTDAQKNLPYRPCVGVVLARPDGMIFAGERIDTPGAWQMPQGGIDKGETPRDAALRELEEEIGVSPANVTIEAETPDWLRYDLPEDLVGKAFKGRFRGQDQKWFLMRLNGSDAVIHIETAHPEFARWQWMQASNLLDAIVPFKRDVYSSVLGAFEGRI